MICEGGGQRRQPGCPPPGSYVTHQRSRGLRVQVFDEHDFVPLFVVQQFVDACTHGEQAESAQPDAFRLSDVHVSNRIAWRLADCGVRELFEVESRTRDPQYDR